MNNFYTVVDFIKNWFMADEDVITVTHGATELTDNQKKNLFPLVHFNVLSAPVQQGLSSFTFEIACLDIRTVVNNEPIADKFLRNDNELDSLNIAYAILNRFVVHLITGADDSDIDYQSLSDMTPVSFAYTNGLDGWVLTVTLTIPNNKINVCEN